MKNLFKNKLFLLGLIVILACFLRFFKLGSVPLELNRDEASLGYTAYSILKTGREEHGQFWPIQIESFGDWKLPLYVYSLIPFIAVFGLEAWVVRLPSALVGIGIIIVSHFLVLRLFDKTQKKNLLAILIPLLLAVSPWQIHFSHVAYEAHLSMFLFILGLLGFLIVKEKFLKLKIRDIRLFSLSMLSWAVTLLGYHAYQAFIPLFFISMMFFYRDFLKRFFTDKNGKYFFKDLFIALLPFMIIGSVLIASGVSGANKTKFSGLSIFSPQSYSLEVGKERQMLPSPNHPFFVFVINKYTSIVNQIETNFFNLISPDFLFIRGGNNGAHNITGYGNLYSFLFFGLVVGIVSIFISSSESLSILGIWLITASVAPMITFAANHTVRFSPGFIPAEILSVYGWLVIFNILRKKISAKFFKIILSIFFIVVFYLVYKFLVTYYFIFPRRDLERWSWQMKSVVFQVDVLKDNYDKVIVQDEQSSPYIYFLFHLKVDPETLSERIEYYPVDNEGFKHVKRFDNIYFEKIDWEIRNYSDENRLFVVSNQEIPDYNRFNENFSLIEVLENDNVKKEVEFWSYQSLQ